VLGATVIGARGHGAGKSSGKTAQGEKAAKKRAERVPLPAEVRGVHVTMALASIGKLDEYLAIPGLNTVELDVKDENGKVGFVTPAGTLPRRIGAAQPYYNAGQAAGKARKAGVYLIGRIVTF